MFKNHEWVRKFFVVILILMVAVTILAPFAYLIM